MAACNFLTLLRLFIIHQLNIELFRKSIQFTGGERKENVKNPAKSGIVYSLQCSVVTLTR